MGVVLAHEVETALKEDYTQTQLAVGAVTGVSAALTVGYVVWAMSGGSLLASVLTTIPMWHFLDPLPVLHRQGDNRKKRKKREISDDDEERLKSLFR